MSIFERVVGAVVGVAAPLLVWNCEVPGQCLRYGDCDQGLTCAAGRCVVPPATDAAAETDVETIPDASSSSLDGASSEAAAVDGAPSDAGGSDGLDSLDSATGAGEVDAAPDAPVEAASDAAGDATAD